MVSGVGFKNTTARAGASTPRKKIVSPALLITFGVLGIVAAAYGIALLWHASLQRTSAALTEEIAAVNDNIRQEMEGNTGDFGVRAAAMQKDLYKDYETNDLLREVENIMIKKSSDGTGARVVLKSFQYNAGAYDRQTFGNTVRTVTGKGSLTISADADSFDVMAQQIDRFKASPLFDAVRVGSTDRDESGRIIFTLTMDVNGHGVSPYEDTSMTATGAVYGITEEEAASTKASSSAETEATTANQS